MKIPKKDSCEIRLAELAKVKKNVEKRKKILKTMKIPKKDSCEIRLAGLARVRKNVEKYKKILKSMKMPKKDSCEIITTTNIISSPTSNHKPVYQISVPSYAIYIPPANSSYMRQQHSQRSSLFRNTPALLKPQHIHNTTSRILNKLAHSYYGNRVGRVVLTIGYWNCGKGLLDSNNFATSKLAEIETFINQHDLDVCTIAEAGLHGRRSQTMRAFPATTTIIHNALRIPGFSIILPKSWEQHHTARIYMYVKDSLVIKSVTTTVNNTDLPNINIEVKKGKSAPTIVSSHYREFTGGVSGLKTMEAQLERLVRHTEVWRQLDHHNKDVIIMGDTNLCYRKWSINGSPQQALINNIKEAQADAALHQLVDTDTRYQVFDDVVEK